MQQLQIWQRGGKSRLHTLLASAKDHSSDWFLFDLCGRCWIGFGGLIGQGWIWNDMNVFMLSDFMIFLNFSYHICTKTTIDHRLLELLPRFHWETPCTGQGWHCLRQWLKRVRPVRHLSHGRHTMSTWIFSGSVHRPTIGIQIHSSDHRHHLRSFPGRIAFESKRQRWQYLAMPASVTHVTHVTRLWGVSCSKASSVLTFSQILRLSDPKKRLNEACFDGSCKVLAWSCSTLHMPTMLLSCVLVGKISGWNWSYQHDWWTGHSSALASCCQGETMHAKHIQYPCHWTKAKKKKKFPTDKVAERAGGWK